MRGLVMAVVLMVSGGAWAQTPGLDAAVRSMPAMFVGENIDMRSSAVPLGCPRAGARVEQKGGPDIEYLGAVPGRPELCRVRMERDEQQLWYGLWGDTWPGGPQASLALRKIIAGGAGDVTGFDTVAAPGVQWHDVVRNEGVESILLLGHVYRTMKLSHYREGFGGNVYRSMSTVWKDIETGLPVYGTYQHMAGAPELDGALIPSKIVPAPR